MEMVQLDDVTAIPFQVCTCHCDLVRCSLLSANQVQILYTARDGSRRLRVATTSIAVSEDATEAEKGVCTNVVAHHAAKRAAQYAKVTLVMSLVLGGSVRYRLAPNTHLFLHIQRVLDCCKPLPC